MLVARTRKGTITLFTYLLHSPSNSAISPSPISPVGSLLTITRTKANSNLLTNEGIEMASFLCTEEDTSNHEGRAVVQTISTSGLKPEGLPEN